MCALILVAFIIVIVVTYNTPRESDTYMTAMVFFFFFLCFALMIIFIALLRGLKINFGHKFKRHIYIHDPKTNKNHYIDDDGTNVINNNSTLTGKLTE